MTKKARQVIPPQTKKIQAKLSLQTNSPFSMEVHDFCLSPKTRKAIEQAEHRQAPESESVHKLFFSYTFTHRFYSNMLVIIRLLNLVKHFENA